jgi:hypothetical protein
VLEGLKVVGSTPRPVSSAAQLPSRVLVPLWAGFSYDHFGKPVPFFTSAILVLGTIALGYGIDDGRKAELRAAS